MEYFFTIIIKSCLKLFLNFDVKKGNKNNLFLEKEFEIRIM